MIVIHFSVARPNQHSEAKNTQNPVSPVKAFIKSSSYIVFSAMFKVVTTTKLVPYLSVYKYNNNISCARSGILNCHRSIQWALPMYVCVHMYMYYVYIYIYIYIYIIHIHICVCITYLSRLQRVRPTATRVWPLVFAHRQVVQKDSSWVHLPACVSIRKQNKY